MMNIVKSMPFCLLFFVIGISNGEIPIVLNTWKFTAATADAFRGIISNFNAVEVVTLGCSSCEHMQCDFTVGYGGSPDENGETTLDAMIFDGATMNMGAVAGLRSVKQAARVAKLVLEHTEHSILVGDLATDFAKQLGHPTESLTTKYSKKLWEKWLNSKCQPNFWRNVEPNPKQSCGPYSLPTSNEIPKWNKYLENTGEHDTIGMIAITSNGDIAVGTSSNGANHKIPGRVGDAPLVGAGGFAENGVGGAVATGDGDIMMRFLPSFLAVELIRQGKSATEAAEIAIGRIAQKYPNFMGAVLATNHKGEYGAACNGIPSFPFSVATNSTTVAVKYVICSNPT